MIKRTLFFSNPYHLHTSKNQLVVDDKSLASSKTIPIEDIGFVIFEHPQITFSQGLMRLFLEHNVSVIFCDEKYLPSGILLNLEGNNLQSARFRTQLKISTPLKKNLWMQTVKQKLINQSQILESEGLNYEPLVYKASQVKSGDSTNEEAKGAAIYWASLFGKDFRRERYGESPNSLLNYGYAVLRAAVARALAGTGLHPTIGIFHRNQYNAFCLADDIMEPYRVFVDRLTLDWLKVNSGLAEITKEAKMHMLGVLAMDVEINNRNRPLMLALSETTSSLAECFEGFRKNIKYGKLVR